MDVSKRFTRDSLGDLSEINLIEDLTGGKDTFVDTALDDKTKMLLMEPDTLMKLEILLTSIIVILSFLAILVVLLIIT